MRVCVCVCTRVACCMCGSQRMTWSWWFPSVMWALRLLSGLPASAFTCWGISAAQDWVVLRLFLHLSVPSSRTVCQSSSSVSLHYSLSSLFLHSHGLWALFFGTIESNGFISAGCIWNFYKFSSNSKACVQNLEETETFKQCFLNMVKFLIW